MADVRIPAQQRSGDAVDTFLYWAARLVLIALLNAYGVIVSFAVYQAYGRWAGIFTVLSLAGTFLVWIITCAIRRCGRIDAAAPKSSSAARHRKVA